MPCSMSDAAPTPDDPAPDKFGCVLLANGLLLAMGLGGLVLHVRCLHDLFGSRKPPGLDFTELGVSFLAIVSGLVAIPLLIAGFARGVVPGALRRVELTVAATILASVAAEIALVAAR